MLLLYCSNYAMNIPQGQQLFDEINRLKKEMNAVILSHYYQDDDIQDIADFIGDSLDLSKKAAATDADYIIFCGVKFMGEVAKILSPQKTVLIPDMGAGCSLETSCPPKDFAKFRQENPDHIAITYINCSAEVKALSDIIVTSSCAKKVIDSLPKDEKIIFAPDKNLGAYLNKITGRNMLLWQGACMVHEQFSERELIKLKTKYPQAHIIAHPECPEHLLSYAHHIGSTSSLLKYANDNKEICDSYIVLTESGIIHQMKKNAPENNFYDVPGLFGEGGRQKDGANTMGCANCNNCSYMRMNTLEKLYIAMRDKSPEIILDEELRLAAKKPLDKMLELSV